MTPVLDFIHQTTPDDFSDEMVHEATRCLIDTVGVAVSGSQTDLSRIIRNHAARQYAGTGASLWQDGRTVSPAGAALANATTIDSMDAHDGHKLVKGHIGCAVIPGLIAMMQAEGKSDPAELLTSIVIGYEIGTRAGIALHASASDYHTSGAWVCLAVAALGARQLGLTQAQTREAIGIAEYNGPRSQMMRTIDAPTMIKDGSGWGAMTGVSAAYLAADGFTGAPAVTVEDPALSEYWNDLGTTWYVTDQYVKLYPVCRWAQPVVEAILSLAKEHKVTHDQVARIHVQTFHEARRLTCIPVNTEQAQYSLPFPAAAALVRGKVGVAEVTDDGLNDSQIIDLAKRVEISETDRFNTAFPAQRFAKVHLHLHNGSVLTSPDTQARGDPESRLSDNQIFDKFRELSSPVTGSKWAERFITMANELSGATTTQPLFAMLGDA